MNSPLPRHFNNQFNYIVTPAVKAHKPVSQEAAPAFHTRVKAHQALRELLGESEQETRLFDIFERIIVSEEAPTKAGKADPALQQKQVQSISQAFQELLGDMENQQSEKAAACCRVILKSLEDDMAVLQDPDNTIDIAPPPPYSADEHDHAHHHGDGEHGEEEHHHHHHHEQTRFKKLMKKMLGTSDIDEGPHGVIGAKTGITAIIKPDDDQGMSKLEIFQHHEVAANVGSAVADGLLSGVLMGAGGLGHWAGKNEKAEGKEGKRGDLRKRTELLEKRSGFISKMREYEQINAGCRPHEMDQEVLQSCRLLETEVRIMDAELDRLNLKLKHVDHQIGLGRGSEYAGGFMMTKGLIDIITRPLAYANEIAAPIAASVTGFAGLALSPAAAGAGLYMGYHSKKLSRAQLAEYRERLQNAARAYDLIKGQLPREIQQDYDRFFANGKWATQEQGLKAFDRLMSYFVGGMAGYTAGITALSAAKLAALIIGTTAVVDVTASTAIIVSVAAVLYGTYGFMKYHAKMHEHQEWAESDDPEFDAQFMKVLAALGEADSISLPTAMGKMLDDREANRNDFLVAMASRSSLRFSRLKIYSTDTQETRDLRIAQKTEGKNHTQRFLASSARLGKNIVARARTTGSFTAGGFREGVHAGNWKSAFRAAEDAQREETAHRHDHHHGHDHGHVHGHSHEHVETDAVMHEEAHLPVPASPVEVVRNETLTAGSAAAHAKTSTASASNAEGQVQPMSDLHEHAHTDGHPHEHKHEHEHKSRHEHGRHFIWKAVKKSTGKILAPVNDARHISAKTLRNVMRPATQHASAVYAKNTAYLNAVNLATGFSSAANYPAMVDMMLNDARSSADYIDQKIKAKLDAYDRTDSSVGEADAPLPLPDVPVEDTAAGGKSREGKRHLFSHSEKKVATPKEKKITPPDEIVAGHWREVGLKLAYDEARSVQAEKLAAQLVEWKRAPDNKPENMHGMIAQYLLLMRGKLEVTSEEEKKTEGKSMEQQLAEHLMKEAPERHRKNRSRLNTVFLATAPLRLDAAMRRFEERERNGRYMATTSANGAPQIALKPGRSVG